MRAELIIHDAGTDYTSGAAINANNISMSVAAGVTPPTLSFDCLLADAPYPRDSHATLLINGYPVETVFTVLDRGVTLSSNKALNSASLSCDGALSHLDEIASLTGWSDTSINTFAASAITEINNRASFQARTGINSESFSLLQIIDTIARGTDTNAGSVDKFSKELQSLLGAVQRYAIDSGLPLDWVMDTNRSLSVSSPLRAARNGATDYIAGHNCEEITESVDLSVGRVASRVIAGTIDANNTTTLDAIEGRFGQIDMIAASGSSSAIVNALSAQMRTFSIALGSSDVSFSSGVPSLWVGDRVRVRNSNDEWSSCAIVSAGLSVDDGGRSASVSAVAIEGDW